MKITIDLEMAQRIVILLSEFPYKNVSDIIDEIKRQANNNNN